MSNSNGSNSRRKCIYELPDWPNFSWKQDELAVLVNKVHEKQRHLESTLAAQTGAIRNEVLLTVLIDEVLSSAAIEDEFFCPALTRMVVAEQLGLVPIDEWSGGVTHRCITHGSGNCPREDELRSFVSMVLDAQDGNDWNQLNEARLFQWCKQIYLF